MRVRDVMRKDVVSIEPEASIRDAIKKMVSENITSLIVEDKNGSIHGIITRKDIITKVIAYDKNLNTCKVSEVMSEPLLSVSPDITLEAVARLMAKTDIRRFPVLDNGKIVGLVSNSDVMKAYLQQKRGK